MLMWLIAAAVVVWLGVIGVVAVVTSKWPRKRRPQTPRELKHSVRRWLPMFVATWALQVYVGVTSYADGRWGLGVFVVASALLGVVVFVHWTSATPTETEAQENFAGEPQFCGRCAYDLAGNTSGVCPECGWVIPKGDRAEARHPSRA